MLQLLLSRKRNRDWIIVIFKTASKNMQNKKPEHLESKSVDQPREWRKVESISKRQQAKRLVCFLQLFARTPDILDVEVAQELAADLIETNKISDLSLR